MLRIEFVEEEFDKLLRLVSCETASSYVVAVEVDVKLVKRPLRTDVFAFDLLHLIVDEGKLESFVEGRGRIVDEMAEGIRRADGIDAFRFVRQAFHIGADGVVNDDDGRVEITRLLIFGRRQSLFCTFFKSCYSVL